MYWETKGVGLIDPHEIHILGKIIFTQSYLLLLLLVHLKLLCVFQTNKLIFKLGGQSSPFCQLRTKCSPDNIIFYCCYLTRNLKLGFYLLRTVWTIGKREASWDGFNQGWGGESYFGQSSQSLSKSSKEAGDGSVLMDATHCSSVHIDWLFLPYSVLPIDFFLQNQDQSEVRAAAQVTDAVLACFPCGGNRAFRWQWLLCLKSFIATAICLLSVESEFRQLDLITIIVFE